MEDEKQLKLDVEERGRWERAKEQRLQDLGFMDIGLGFEDYGSKSLRSREVYIQLWVREKESKIWERDGKE